MDKNNEQIRITSEQRGKQKNVQLDNMTNPPVKYRNAKLRNSRLELFNSEESLN